MSEPEQQEIVEAEVAVAPDPELADAVEPYLPTGAELSVIDSTDRHEALVRMDEHDVRQLLERVQSAALRKWVYELPSREKGLTVHAVQDIVQFMNWSGKCRIGTMPETLAVERIIEDAGHGDEPFWVATIFAKDDITGQMQPGSSMEPVRMRLRASTAQQKRSKGMKIPEDNTIFDVFSRTKAIQKAVRNAQGAFIPEVIEQTVIAMFSNDPARVERIQTEAEAKVADMPPPLDTPEAKALTAELEAIYAEVRELGNGQGKIKLTPGQYGAYLLQSQHDLTLLERMKDWLLGRKEQIEGELA